MNFPDYIWLSQAEQIIIALLIMRDRQIAAIIGLAQLVVLNLGAVAAVKDQDALGGGSAEGGGGFGRDWLAHAACSCWALLAFSIDTGRLPSKWQIA